MDACECGELKREDRDVCYKCFIEKMKREDRVCECGKIKSSEYDCCIECSTD